MHTDLLKLFLLTIVFSTGIFACSKDDDVSMDDTIDNDNKGFYFEAKIDDSDFSADMTSCECNTPADFKTEAYKHSNGLYIRAKKNTGNAREGEFFISVGTASNPYSGSGEYSITQGFSTESSGEYGEGGTTWYAGGVYPGSGTVIITKDENNIVEGTFSFDANTDPAGTVKKITEGKFRMKY